MKCAIIYASVHHGNTKKLVDAIVSQCNVDLIDATQKREMNLLKYDLIGFASGIYHSKYHEDILSFAKVNMPQQKDVFFIYTSGTKKNNYLKSIKEAISNKNATIKGIYHCLGYDTYGPFGMIGGIAKGHPAQEEIDGAVEFVKELLQGD